MAIVVIVIIVFASLGAYLYHFTDFGGAPDEPRLTVNLSPPTTPQMTVRNGTSVWDTSLVIRRFTPADRKVLWAEVSVVIKSDSGSILLPSTYPSRDWHIYDQEASIGVEVWYVESDGDNSMDAGDAIKFTGMTTVFEGAALEMSLAGERIAAATLPTNFP